MHQLSARQIRDKVVAGEVTAVEVTEYFLDRIDSYNDKIGAFLVVLRERALVTAKRVDAKRSAGEPLGKLAGVPIGIKDNMHIEGELTTCASKFLTNYKAPFSATVTRLLEQEDAILIGKTNMDEFAMGSSTEHSALLQTGNPWNLSCSPGGSSGGSAAAVAARLCPIALGSDTGGSIRQPASWCGVVGMKPTYGRVSRFGLVAFASSLDQIGPFATTTEDVGLVMEVLGQHCDRDSTSVNKAPEKYLDKLPTDLEGVKVGVPWGVLEDLTPELRKHFESSVKDLEKLGAETVEITMSLIKHSIPVYYILSTAEASTNLARFDGVRYGQRSEKAKSLAQIYDLSRAEGFGPEVKRRIMLGTFVLSAGYQEAYYKKAQKIRTLIIEQFTTAFEKCDLIAMPVCPSVAFARGQELEPVQEYLKDLFTISANLAGVPGISVPSGFSESGKPVGLQFLGPQLDDVKMCHAAYAFEKHVGAAAKKPEMAK